MAIAIPVHRALTTRLAPRSFNVVTRWGYNPWLARVNADPNNEHNIKPSQLYLKSSSRHPIATRSYATKAAAKPKGRPKAHTGRAPAKRSTKTSTTSKPGPKTAAGKKAVGRKPKATKVKTKAKPKPKKPTVKKAPTASALLKQRRAKDKELKEKALLDPPKQLPATPWSLIFSEAHQNARAAPITGQASKDASEKFKNLTPEEKEHYNHLANQNKATNVANHKKWLSQYSPDQVREANLARAQLKRQQAEKNPKRVRSHKFGLLKDDRLVTRPRTGYVQFSKDRHASGDFAHMTISEASKLIGREWKSIDAAEKKKYDALQEADRQRYVEEHISVYGRPPVQAKKTKAS